LRKELFLVFFMLTILCIPILPAYDYDESVSISQEVVISPSQLLHDPVYITSDAQFASAGFEGDGTPENPYRLYSLYIPSDALYGIWISNTDAFFEIWDCLITGSTTKGIGIWNCVNANITDTIVLGADTSISIEITSVAWIENCQLTPNAEGIGLALDEVTIAMISDCTITGGLIGSYIISSTASFIENSIVDSNNGIVGESTRLGFFLSNTFENCSGYGIKLEESSYACTIANNSFTGFITGGILLRSSQSMIVMSNNFTHCGLTVVGSGYYHFSHVVIGNLVNSKPLLYLLEADGGSYFGDDYGQIYLVSCTDVTISGGLITSTQRGVFFAYSSECTVENIMITACQVGVDIDDSEFITVQNCTIRSCNTGVLFFSGAVNNSILNNEISYSYGNGVLINPSAKSNLLVNNSFHHNDGLLDDGAENAWDDGVQFGNFYDDFYSSSSYAIFGTAGSVDHYPRRYTTTGTSGSSLPPMDPIFIVTLGITLASVIVVLLLMKRFWSSKSI